MARPNVGFIAIVPKRPIVDFALGKVKGRLRDLGADVTSDMSEYPSQRATTYRRTGTLGRNWTMRGPSRIGNDLIVTVGNNLEYAPFVQGFKRKAPRQTAVAKRYNWPSVEDVAKSQWDAHKRKVQDALAGK